MYEEQIEGLAELILELMPDRTHEKRVKKWIDGMVGDIAFAERKRAKEIIMSCIHGKLP
jgi:hypothetical protein